MNSAVVAIDHSLDFGDYFESFCSQVRAFQQNGFFREVSVVSLMHASQYLLPYRFYRDSKYELTAEAINKLKAACEGRFEFDSVKVIHANSHDKEHHVSLLSRYAKSSGADVVIVGSHDRKGLPAWFLGSFSATATLRGTVPVLVLKPGSRLELSKPRIALAVDAASPPDAKATPFVAKAAKVTRSEVDLVYIEPSKRSVIDSLQQRKGKDEATKVLGKLQTKLKQLGVSSNSKLLPESLSVAHAIADFAEKRKAFLTVCIAAKRSRMRKLLLGSTARQVLTLSQRPFLSVRWC